MIIGQITRVVNNVKGFMSSVLDLRFSIFLLSISWQPPQRILLRGKGLYVDYVNFVKSVFITAETGRALASSVKCVVSDEMGDNKLLKLSCINDNEEIIGRSSEEAVAFCPRRGTLDYHSLSTLLRRVEGG